MHDPYAVTAAPVVPHANPQPRRRVRWAVAGPAIIGALGLMMATATLTVFMLWKGSVAVQLSQLRAELATAQSQATSTGTGLSGLSRRMDGMTHDVDALQGLVGGYSTVCSTDLTGPNGPAVFFFLCQQKR